MKHRPFSESRKIARKYPKSCLVGKSCFGKTIYPNEAEARKGVTILWGRDPRADINDLHAYVCENGCGFHIGHKSYYEKTKHFAQA